MHGRRVATVHGIEVNAFGRRSLSIKELKMKVYNAVVVPKLLYGHKSSMGAC